MKQSGKKLWLVSFLKLFQFQIFSITQPAVNCVWAHGIMSPPSSLQPNIGQSYYGKSRIPFQINRLAQQICVNGMLTRAVDWYAVSGLSHHIYSWTGCAIGMRGTAFFCAYQIQPLASRFDSKWYIGYCIPLSPLRMNSELSFPISMLLKPSTFKTQLQFNPRVQASGPRTMIPEVRRLAKTGAIPLLKTQMLEGIRTELGLTAANVDWHAAQRCLFIEAPEVEVHLLADWIRSFYSGQIRAVQVCTESLKSSAPFSFPCSLEICCRVNQLQFPNLTTEMNPLIQQLELVNCQIHGDLAWYAPFSELSLKGKIYINGDAFFQVQALRLTLYANLHVTGSLGIFTELSSGTRSFYTNTRVGLFLECASKLIARQCIMHLNRFCNAFNARVGFLNGGIILIKHKEINSSPIFQYVPESFLESEGLGESSRDAYWRSTPVKELNETEDISVMCCSFFTPGLSLPRFLKHAKKEGPFNHSAGNLGKELWFGQHRKLYYQSSLMPELGEAMNELGKGWNLFRSVEILSMLSGVACQQEHFFVQQSVGKRAASFICNGGYGVALFVRDRAFPLRVQPKQAALIFCGLYQLGSEEIFKKIIRKLQTRATACFAEVIQLMKQYEADAFIPHGIHKLYVLYDQSNQARYQAALHFWNQIPNPFFNAATFKRLMGPFLAYYPT